VIGLNAMRHPKTPKNNPSKQTQLPKVLVHSAGPDVYHTFSASSTKPQHTTTHCYKHSNLGRRSSNGHLTAATNLILGNNVETDEEDERDEQQDTQQQPKPKKSKQNKKTRQEENGEYTDEDTHIPAQCTRDEKMATSLIGTKVFKSFKPNDPAVGTVTGYYVFDENKGDPKSLSGYIIHQVEYETNDFIENHTKDDFTTNEVLEGHHKYNLFNNERHTPINLNQQKNHEPAITDHSNPPLTTPKELPIPKAYRGYHVIFFHENKAIRAKITRRVTDESGDTLWKITPTVPNHQEQWVD
jgi:hypothetical protein